MQAQSVLEQLRFRHVLVNTGRRFVIACRRWRILRDFPGKAFRQNGHGAL